MALTWDLTEIENNKELCWLENKDPNKKEGENFVLNPVTEALIHLGMFTGISKITEKNYKELCKRLVELEIVGLACLPQEDTTTTGHIPSNLHPNMMRNPRPHEVKLHIGLQTNVTQKDTRKWGNEIRRLVRQQAEEFIDKYLSNVEKDKVEPNAETGEKAKTSA